MLFYMCGDALTEKCVCVIVPWLPKAVFHLSTTRGSRRPPLCLIRELEYFIVQLERVCVCVCYLHLYPCQY